VGRSPEEEQREALSALQASCQPCAASKSHPREVVHVKEAQNRAECCSMEGSMGGPMGSTAWHEGEKGMEVTA